MAITLAIRERIYREAPTLEPLLWRAQDEEKSSDRDDGRLQDTITEIGLITIKLLTEAT